jgi:tetratricopeptide (TPR) repeat protein
MKYPCWFIASGFITLLISGCSQPQPQPQPQSKPRTPGEIAKLIKASVVLITYQDNTGNGTGFFVQGEKGVCTVVTARHVVVPSSNLRLQTKDGKNIKTSNVRRFPNQDLAVVTFDAGGENCPYKALELGDSDKVNEGDGIYITGFPGGSSVPQFVQGTVSALDKRPDGYGISYPVIAAGGMSGGPAVNIAGEVIAIHGRSDQQLVEKAKLAGENLPPQQQSATSVTAGEGVEQINTFKWGIPSNIYKANISNIVTDAVAKSSATTAEELWKIGNDLSVSERYEEAIASYDKAVEIKPDYSDAWINRGNALAVLKRYEEASASYDKAIQFKPDDSEAWYNRGVALDDLKRYEEALASYDKAIQFKPDYHEAWNNRGIALSELKRYEDAIASYDKAIQFKPDKHEAWNNRGRVLLALERYEDALASFDKAIQFKPDDSEAWYGRGLMSGLLHRYEEAIASFDKAVQIKPDYHEAWYVRGLMLAELKRYDEALESYDKAIKFDPSNQLAINNRKELLTKMGRSQ